MAPLPLFAWPLFLTTAGVIVSWASQYGHDGIIGMWQYRPNIQRDGYCRVRLWLGMPTTINATNPGLGGDLPDVQTYDELGNSAGMVARYPDDHKSRAGDHYDWYLQPEDRMRLIGNNSAGWKRPEYLRIFHGGREPICVAAIGIQMPPDAREVHIMGDMMHKCGWRYYDSGWSWKFGHRLETLHRPKCFWLGGNSADSVNTVWLHIPDWDGEATARLYDEKPQRMCASEPRLLKFTDTNPDAFTPLVFNPPMTYADRPDGTVGDTDIKATQHDPTTVFDEASWAFATKDGLKKPTLDEPLFKQTRPGRWPRKQVVSDMSAFHSLWTDHYSLSNSTEAQYSAENKCQDKGFAGPDWANSHERKYCIMETDQVVPFCDEPDQVYCFDLENEVLRQEVSAQAIKLLGEASTATAPAAAAAAAAVGRKKTVRHDFRGAV